ncbi:MAG: hypothetical protein P8Z37_19085 [Acidobacteriota bacterium]
MIFDTHCHAYWSGLEARHEAIRSRMDAENVVRSVQVGTDWDTNHSCRCRVDEDAGAFYF